MVEKAIIIYERRTKYQQSKVLAQALPAGVIRAE